MICYVFLLLTSQIMGMKWRPRLITNDNVYDEILQGCYECTSIDYRERWKDDINWIMISWSRVKIEEDLGSTLLQLKSIWLFSSSVSCYYDTFSINEIFNFSNSQMTLILIIGMSWKAKMCDKGMFMKRQWNSLILFDILWYPLIFVDILWHSLIFFDIFSIFLNIFLDNP